MSVFLEYGEPSLTYRSDGKTFKSLYYTWRATGTRGSIKRKKPASLLTNLTGYSSGRSEHIARNYTVPPPIPLYPGTVYTTSAPAQGAIGDAVGTGLLTADDIASLVRNVDAKLLQRIKGMDWNAGASAGEAGETVGFIANTARDVFDYYKAARKGDFLALSNLYHNRDARGKRRPPFPERIGNRYLAFRFAVRPLCQDLDNAMAAIHRSGVKPFVRLVTASAETTKSEFVKEPDWQGNPAFPITYQATDTLKIKRGAYFSVDPDVERWKSYGFTNLASVVWELTPYSFMVDRILPIGQFIDSLDAAFGVSLISDWRSQKRTSVGVRTIADGWVRTDSKSYSRSTGFGIPTPVLPRFSPRGGATGWTDLLAILWQMKNRSPKGGF